MAVGRLGTDGNELFVHKVAAQKEAELTQAKDLLAVPRHARNVEQNRHVAAVELAGIQPLLNARLGLFKKFEGLAFLALFQDGHALKVEAEGL